MNIFDNGLIYSQLIYEPYVQTLHYLINSVFHSELPWISCGNWWNTDCCSSQERHKDFYLSFEKQKSIWTIILSPWKFENGSIIRPSNCSGEFSNYRNMERCHSRVSKSYGSTSPYQFENSFKLIWLYHIQRLVSKYKQQIFAITIFFCQKWLLNWACFKIMKKQEYWSHRVLQLTGEMTDVGGMQWELGNFH